MKHLAMTDPSLCLYPLFREVPKNENSDPFATEPTGKENDWVTDLSRQLRSTEVLL